MARPQANSKAGSKSGNGDTADRVWTVAAQLFRQKGYHATTTRELADRLEITRASLYYYVTKKEDLLYGICAESLRRVSEAVRAAVDAEADPIERVRVLIVTHLASMLTDIDMHATMLLDLQQLTGDQLAEVRSLRDDYESLVGSIVKDAQAAGGLRADVSDRLLTLALLNHVNWTITWYRPGGKLRIDQLAEVLATTYLDGTRST